MHNCAIFSFCDTPMFVAGYFLRGYILVFHMAEGFSIRKIWSQFPWFDSTIIILHTLENIKHIFLAVLLTNFICFDDKLSKLIYFTEENVVYRSIKTNLKEYDYCKKKIKEHFNKNLVMSEKDEQICQSNNKCWICDELFDVGDKKVKDLCKSVIWQENIEVILIGVIILILDWPEKSM